MRACRLESRTPRTYPRRSGPSLRSLPRTGPRRRPATRPRPARGFRRLEVGRARGSALAHAAARLPALGGRLPADAKVARSRGVRGHGPRPARGTPLGSGQGGRAHGRRHGRPHLALRPRERSRGRLRRREAEEGLEDPRRRRHPGAPARAARRPGGRARPGAGGGVGEVSSGGWRRTTSGCPRRWRGCTSSPSLASSCTERSPCSARVHNSL